MVTVHATFAEFILQMMGAPAFRIVVVALIITLISQWLRRSPRARPNSSVRTWLTTVTPGTDPFVGLDLLLAAIVSLVSYILTTVPWLTAGGSPALISERTDQFMTGLFFTAVLLGLLAGSRSVVHQLVDEENRATAATLIGVIVGALALFFGAWFVNRPDLVPPTAAGSLPVRLH